MKVSERWLREWVSPDITTQSLADGLTMAGLEVDGIENSVANFSGVIVVQVEKITPIDDKFIHYVVSDGSKQYNCVSKPEFPLSVNQKVPFAPVGASLPDGKIVAKNIAGVNTEGVLCAKESLGLEEQSSTHWYLPNDLALGQDVAKLLHLDDSVIEIDLTPNRGDCASIRGIAREVGALNGCDVKEAVCNTQAPDTDDSFSVEIKADKACTHYVGRVIKNINAQAVTPLWMQEKLNKVGVRVIHPVVDITNYVMMELGQPMHAFDFAKLNKKIVVRFAKKGETITLLDGSEIKCDDQTLLITDDVKPLAIAGIMGGEDSGTSASTTDIFLESALFDAPIIATKARALGISTDSSYRFERGVDFDLQVRAIERATELVKQICGGQAGPVIDKTTAYHPKALRQVSFSPAKINLITGLSLDAASMKNYLQALGFAIQSEQNDCITVQVPSHRYDIERQEDIAEEVARMHGYDNIPEATLPAPSKQMVAKQTLSIPRIKTFMADNGFSEVISYSFIDPALHAQLGFGEGLQLKNPIASDMSLMRTSLWPGLVQTLVHNARRQQQDMKLFEQGLVFIPGKTLVQTDRVGGLVTGVQVNNWRESNQQADFYHLKGVVESLWRLGGHAALTFVPTQMPVCHPNQCADILYAGQSVGKIGRLHPKIQQQLDIATPVYMFELDTQVLCQAEPPIKCQMPSKFPQIRRDLAFVLKKTQATGDIIASIMQQDKDIIQKVELFDVYEGKGVPENHKSVALGVIMQHATRTLVDTQVDELINKIVTHLSKNFEAQLRE